MHRNIQTETNVCRSVKQFVRNGESYPRLQAQLTRTLQSCHQTDTDSQLLILVPIIIVIFKVLHTNTAYLAAIVSEPFYLYIIISSIDLKSI